ncbi:MAG: EAL domain-containing protein [Rubellimicrobium sp.]|nr:EAL domain-containing protein [Rubellimicrobium sp.]
MPAGPYPLLAVLAVVAVLVAGAVLAVVRIRRLEARIRGALAAERRRATYYRMSAENARDGLVIHDTNLTILWANPAYLRMMGQPAEKVIGHTPLDFAFPPGEAPRKEDVIATLRAAAESGREALHIFRNTRGDGTQFWNQINFGFQSDEKGESHVVLVCRDVTRAVEQEEDVRRIRDRLEHEARHDGLTGAANRTEFLRFTREVLEGGTRTGQRVALLHIDLDRFKDINDTHGHSAGDAALIHAARELKGAVRRSDMVARVGGDEFVVVCPGVPDLATLERLARGLAAAIARPFRFNDMNLYTRASFGCALSTLGETDPQALLLQSDFALYEAKHAGRSRVTVYDEGLHQRHIRMQRRATDLRDAVETGGLDHVFQPVVELSTGRIAGFETLVRWHHETEGIISPADFLPMAEDLGLLATLDLLSMEAALSMKRRLGAAGYGQTVLSFNASSDLLRHPSFINRLVFGAEAAGMDRSQIAIEVLETTVFTDQDERDSPARIIRDLRDAGFHVYLDDFGMGYAGLAHLAELAITGIKLDQLLVKRMLTNETSAKIVATIIELCRDLGLRMIAEGVEDATTAQRLRQMGCPLIQGYWLSPPVSGDNAMAFVTGHNGTIALPRSRRRLSAV